MSFAGYGEDPRQSYEIRVCVLSLYAFVPSYLVPTNTSKLKRSKPEGKVIRVRSSESIEKLKACFDCTVWEEFHHGYWMK